MADPADADGNRADVRGFSPVVRSQDTTADSPDIDRDVPGKWSGLLWRFLQRILILLTLYVLSIGPLYWTWYGARFAGGSLIVAAFYEPLIRVANWNESFGKWLDWYVGLWIS